MDAFALSSFFSLLDIIGKNPIIELKKLSKIYGNKIYSKLEMMIKVTVFPDRGERYISKLGWQNQVMQPPAERRIGVQIPSRAL